MKFVILDPIYKFSMEFEFYVQVEESKNLLIFLNNEDPLIKIKEI